MPEVWGYVTRLLATTAKQRVKLTSFTPRRPQSRICRASPGRNVMPAALPGSLLWEGSGRRDEAAAKAGATLGCPPGAPALCPQSGVWS